MQARKDASTRIENGMFGRWSPIACVTALLVGLLTSVVQAEPGPSAKDGIVYMRHSVFRIPINVDPTKAATIRELRLLVSKDRGATWKHLKTATPTQPAFTYRAGVDGEYWFSLVRVDKQGNVEPSNVRRQPPGLKVVLDTKSPEIDLKLNAANGSARAHWKVTDEQVDLSTLKLEVRKTSDTVWRDLPIRNRSAIGRIEWPTSETDGYSVRALVHDRAGNVGVAQLDLLAEATPPSPEPIPRVASRADRTIDAADPLMSRKDAALRVSGAQPAVAKDEPRRLRFDDERFEQPTPPSRVESPTPIPIAKRAVPAIPRPAVSNHSNPVRESPSRFESPSRRRDGIEIVNSTDGAINRPQLRSIEPVRSISRSAPRASRQPPVDENIELAEGQREQLRATLEMATRIPVASTNAPVRQTAAQRPGFARPAAKKAPTRPRIPLVNSHRFQIDYELRSVGPSGVGKVELYYTTDNGALWQLYGIDEDRLPPFEVAFPKDGSYGLKVVVTSPAGRGQTPPKEGEAPKVVLELDTVPPTAVLYQPTADPTTDRNALLISWKASDPHLSRGPVSLYYAEKQDGRWTPIKTGLPATGHYSWVVPDGIGYQVYLRLMVVDLGKNASVAETEKPIVVDFATPEAEVIRITTLPPTGLTR